MKLQPVKKKLAKITTSLEFGESRIMCSLQKINFHRGNIVRSRRTRNYTYFQSRRNVAANLDFQRGTQSRSFQGGLLSGALARSLLIRASIKEATTFLHGCLEPTTNHVHQRTLAAETTDTPGYNYYAPQIVILHATLRCATRNNTAANSAANFYLASRDSTSRPITPRPFKKK